MPKPAKPYSNITSDEILKESFKYKDASDFDFSLRSQTEKHIHTLEGILKGIVIDEQINRQELREIQSWCAEHIQIANQHPFNELIPVLIKALHDGTLDREIIADMLWLCNNLHMENQYFDIITSDIQRLEGILHGILADNLIEKPELEELDCWLNENTHLQRIYPYEEITDIIRNVLRDGRIDRQEHDLLKAFFSNFISAPQNSGIDKKQLPILKNEITLPGVCANQPRIDFAGKYFCFTGISSKADQSEIIAIIRELGGIYIDRVIEVTNYLIVGEKANPCWAFSCYGRKIQRAIHLQKQGHDLILVNENDFWNAVTQCNEKNNTGLK